MNRRAIRMNLTCSRVECEPTGTSGVTRRTSRTQLRRPPPPAPRTVVLHNPYRYTKSTKDVRSGGRRRVLRGAGGGKSELRRAGCRVTPGRRFRPATESATESKPPMAPSGAQARVKGCGKSAPGRRRRRSHGKPHLEQGQIRDEELLAPPESRVGRLRQSAMTAPDK